MQEVLMYEIEDEYDYDDGEIMTLSDGRQLLINPGDIPTTICWSAATPLEIRKAEDTSFLIYLSGIN